MIKAIIVDNEKPAIQLLRLFLEKTKNVEILGCFLNAPEALDKIPVLKPDVAFLDIEMPQMSGLEMAEVILNKNYNIEIVFVTAYNQYALEAFRVNAIDYLLKPIMAEDIENTVKRLLKRIQSTPLPLYQVSEKKTKIYYFSRLFVYGNSVESLVKWRTSKAEELFAYLYYYRENGVPKNDICNALWPDIPLDKVDVYLHTSVYKMKKDLRSFHIPIDIKFSNGCYFMHLPEIYSDIEEFDSILDSELKVDQSNVERCERAFSLYTNHFLESNGYVWAQAIKESYFLKYHNLIKALILFYVKEKNTIAIENIIKPLIDKAPLDEYAHETLLKLYYVKKDRASFVTHYNEMFHLYENELGIKPKPSIDALYKSITKNS